MFELFVGVVQYVKNYFYSGRIFIGVV